jgi:hypothetical protein
VDKSSYQALIGSLIFCLKTRSDIRKEVVYLSTKASNPTVSDMLKARTVLRYLFGTMTWGPSYYTDEGAKLYGHADAAYGVHADGTSQSGYYITIGRYSAPITCSSSAQRSCVSLSSMEAEYVSLSSCGRRIALFRHLLEVYGFPQLEPTTIFEDNRSTIKLAEAPQIARKSRHIHVRHHYIRRLIQDRIVALTYVPSHEMTADMLTKPLSPSLFLPHARRLLNLRPDVLQTHIGPDTPPLPARTTPDLTPIALRKDPTKTYKSALTGPDWTFKSS